MKNITTLLVILGMSCGIFAQIPQKISYQCVVRSSGGSLVTNQSIGIKISILQDTPEGALVYQEIFNPNPKTNANGLLSLEIGSGITVSGIFTSINWSSGTYFLKTEIDPTGTTDYTIISTSQLLSVPYAFHSQTADEIPDNSVTSAKISDGSIVNEDLGNGSVSSAKIADFSIANADLADNSITTTKIADGSVTSAKIADGNVFTADLANNSVTTVKIADESVNSAKILDGSITTLDLTNSSVTSTKIADGTITSADLADGSITSAKISDGTVTNVDLAGNSVTSAKIADGTITTADIANNSVTAAKMSSSGAVANQVLQYSGSSVNWDYASGSIIKYSFLNANCPSSVSFTNTFKKISNIGTLTKLNADSKLEVTFYGRITVSSFANGSTGAYFELRVDDNATTNGRANINIRAAEAGSSGILVCFTGVFSDLSAGTHTISMWVRSGGASTGTGTSATYNPGCWSGDYVIVKEIR